MSARHCSDSSDRTVPARVALGGRILLGALTLTAATIGHASTYLFTVGPHGSYPTIQTAVNQAELLATSDEGDIRVEVKICNDIHGFQYVCPYKENVSVSSAGNTYLSGGWQSDFQTQYADGTNTLVQGTGTDAPTIKVTAGGSGGAFVSRFEVDGSGVAAGYSTSAIAAYAYGNSNVVIIANNLHNNSLLTGAGAGLGGGAGLYAFTGNTGASITIDANIIQSNAVFGTDGFGSYGGGAYVWGTGGKIYFDLNVLTNNSVSNPSGGACHGGGLMAQSNSGSIQLFNNTYTGNQQFACNNGATGDAAEIGALNASVQMRNEVWTNNLAANDPGVYEVFMHAESSANIDARNGLITHGTWGGLYAQTDATSGIIVTNFTIADNPVLGYNGVGPGTQLWNTILWNDGTPYSFSSGATFAFCLYASDPLFIDSAAGNYRLSAGSPAINGGSDQVPNGYYEKDLDNSPRPYAGDGLSISDIGAYEYHVADTIFSNSFGT